MKAGPRCRPRSAETVDDGVSGVADGGMDGLGELVDAFVEQVEVEVAGVSQGLDELAVGRAASHPSGR